MTAVPFSIVKQASENWFNHPESENVNLGQLVGLTSAQVNHWNEIGWKKDYLTTSTSTAKKLEILANGNLEHYEALFKIIEARYG